MSGRNSPGYVLFGVLVGVTLVGVGLTAAVTLWSQVVQREREAELFFRGEAIVRALERFQQDRPGTLPDTLDELVEGRYLRRTWLDPMTGQSFRILRAEDRLDGATPEEERSLAAGETQPTESAATSEHTAGITGVVSTSDLLSFRSYEGARRYSDWHFEAEVSGTAGGNSQSAGAGSAREER